MFNKNVYVQAQNEYSVIQYGSTVLGHRVIVMYFFTVSCILGRPV